MEYHNVFYINMNIIIINYTYSLIDNVVIIKELKAIIILYNNIYNNILINL